MTKIEFQKQILNNREKYLSIICYDSSISNAHSKFATIAIVWKGNLKSPIKNLMGSAGTFKVTHEIKKYRLWAEEILKIKKKDLKPTRKEFDYVFKLLSEYVDTFNNQGMCIRGIDQDQADFNIIQELKDKYYERNY